MTTLLQNLQALEVELHHPGVCCNVHRLEQLLHPDFFEVGRSGRVYDRDTVISRPCKFHPSPAVAPVIDDPRPEPPR